MKTAEKERLPLFFEKDALLIPSICRGLFHRNLCNIFTLDIPQPYYLKCYIGKDQ